METPEAGSKNESAGVTLSGETLSEVVSGSMGLTKPIAPSGTTLARLEPWPLSSVLAGEGRPPKPAEPIALGTGATDPGSLKEASPTGAEFSPSSIPEAPDSMDPAGFEASASWIVGRPGKIPVTDEVAAFVGLLAEPPGSGRLFTPGGLVSEFSAAGTPLRTSTGLAGGMDPSFRGSGDGTLELSANGRPLRAPAAELVGPEREESSELLVEEIAPREPAAEGVMLPAVSLSGIATPPEFELEATALEGPLPSRFEDVPLRPLAELVVDESPENPSEFHRPVVVPKRLEVED